MSRINICRLCLSSDIITYIFKKENIDYSIENKVLNYLSFHIQPTENLPNGICKTCLDHLNAFHAFAQKVYETQAKLQNNFKTLRPVVSEFQNNIQTTLQSIPNDNAKLKNISKVILEESSCNKPNCPKLSQNDNTLNRRTSERNKQKVSGKSEIVLDFTEYNSDTDSLSETDVESFVHNTIKYKSLNKKDFPKQIIKDCKLTISGKHLLKLLAKFFTLECLICTDHQTFTSITVLIDHYFNVHKTKGYVSCCGQKLSKIKSMAMHMASHLQPEAFTCNTCGKVLTCPRILQYHKQNHLPEAERPLACSEADCPRRFSYYSALLAHQNAHLPESKREAHICDECGKIFGTPNALSTHTSKIHRGKGMHDKYKYVCHICAHRFSNSGNLEYHLSTHEHRMTNQVQCTECGKWSKNKQCLTKHMVQHRAVPFSCEFCPYNCKTKQALNSHIQTHHTKGKQHTCNTCGKMFKLKCTLKAHIAQHTGERKYQCTFCSRSFVNSGNFYAHRKRMHPTQLKEYYEERNRIDNEERLRILGQTKCELSTVPKSNPEV